MASSSSQSQQPRPRIRTASTCCAPQTSRATHVFQINGYSTHKGLGAYHFIRSAPFIVGGYEWCISFSPDSETDRNYVGLYLELLSNNAEARVHYEFRLVDQTTRLSVPVLCTFISAPLPMSTVDRSTNNYASGSPMFRRKSELEHSPYLQDDRLVIECDVTVIKAAAVVDTTNLLVEEPWSPNGPDLSQDLAKLLHTKEGADVAFEVQQEMFTAHALVLATRSSVFKAQFYGPLREQQRDQRITVVQDMQPDVFRELLHFIYTDSMSPSMSDLDADDKKQLIQHLLVAADRYDAQRLKDVCERALCESLDVETVSAMLALADQQNCMGLKDACIDFMVSSSDTWDGVAASQGFGNLKRSCPSIMVDILDRAVKSRKN